MKTYFAYTRVSTVKQGEHGVSLQEQTSEIERYASQKGLVISTWFEERETAAKLGRRVFMDLMNRLRKGEAAGVVIHKIDRSARNLRDWVEIGQLSDEGIEVHFTRESLDLQTSSGRLSADVQAVVAANYIRNLREETIKGSYGRLKQGISPLPAPLGYLNAGGGKPKTVDPLLGPLVSEAFSLYASGQFSYHALALEMEHRGLRTKQGRPISLNTLAGMLKNTFYYGLIRIEKNNQVFPGIHQPLISKELFDQVGAVAEGRHVRMPSPTRRTYLFSRLIHCKGCSRTLIAELQKGHVYYRCHSLPCRGVSVREEKIDHAVADILAGLQLGPRELAVLDAFVATKRAGTVAIQRQQIASLELKLAAIKQKLDRLTDAYVEGLITSEILNERKEALLSERLDVEGQLVALRHDSSRATVRMEEFVELVKSAQLLYKSGNHDEKRRVVEKTLSNRQIDGKTLILSLRFELNLVALRHGGPSTGTCRTFWESWLDVLTKVQFAQDPS